MSGARGGEPEETRPRVGGAGCASPSRLRFETRGTAARPGRCGRVVGAGVIRGQRLAFLAQGGLGRPQETSAR